MEIKVHIKNLNEIRSAFHASPKEMARNLQDAIESSGFEIEKESKDIVRTGRGYTKRPFATGRMFGAITHQFYPLRGEIYPTVDYAIYPHEGLSTSRKYGRRPFMEDAVKNKEKFIENVFSQAVEKTLETIAKKSR